MGSRSPRESLEAFCKEANGTYRTDAEKGAYVAYAECVIKSEGGKRVIVSTFPELRNLFVDVGEEDAEGRTKFAVSGSVVRVREVKHHVHGDQFEVTAENERGAGLRLTKNGNTIALHRETAAGDGASVQGLVQWP